MKYDPARYLVGGFAPNDGTVDFYLRVRSLTDTRSTVLDLGAGRAAWFSDDPSATRKKLRNLKGEVAKLIAADIDDAVLSNRACDEQHLMINGVLQLEPSSVDVVIADFVLEHIDDPEDFFSQVDMCLKPGGWLCARTPHKFSYVSLIAMLIKNSAHARVLRVIQPHRKEIDVFPTRYRLNTLRDVKNTFDGWRNDSFIFRTEPAYFFGSRWVFYVQSFLHRVLPVIFSGNLFVFVQKPRD